MRQAFVHTMRSPADHCSDAIKPNANSSATLPPISVPATGYYEWHTVGKEKQPFYFTAPTVS